MQGMRSQEIVVGDKERKEERKGKKSKEKEEQTQDSKKRNKMTEKTARITHGRRKTRGKMEWLSRASIQERLEDCCNKGVGRYISLKKGRIKKKFQVSNTSDAPKNHL